MVYTNLIWVFFLNIVMLLLTIPYIYYKRVHENQPQYRYFTWLSPFSRLASTCGRFSQLTVAAFAFWDQVCGSLSLPRSVSFLSLWARPHVCVWVRV